MKKMFLFITLFTGFIHTATEEEILNFLSYLRRHIGCKLAVRDLKEALDTNEPNKKDSLCQFATKSINDYQCSMIDDIAQAEFTTNSFDNAKKKNNIKEMSNQMKDFANQVAYRYQQDRKAFLENQN